MKLNTYEYPQSSFLGMTKDTALIMNKILDNEKLLKLIYYNDSKCLKQPSLSEEQIAELFTTNQISAIPQIVIDKDRRTYIRITYDSFTPNATNNFYRDHILKINIVCHFLDWNMGDFELRPYLIAGELDSMLNHTRLTGIGLLEFLSADQYIYSEEYGGLTLTYLAIRGTEDRVKSIHDT